MPSTDPTRAKALACLREGRVTVFTVAVAPGEWRIVKVLARVRSSQDRHPYRVHYTDDGWSCTCVAGQRDEACPHAAAVALVTTEAAAA